MNEYNEILQKCKEFRSFDLHRLISGLIKLREDLQKQKEVRFQCRPRLQTSYFDPGLNKLIECEIVKLNPKKVLIQNKEGPQLWELPCYWMNLENKNTDLAF